MKQLPSVSHSRPVNPGLHLHSKSSPFTTQVAWFWHWLGSQGCTEIQEIVTRAPNRIYLWWAFLHIQRKNTSLKLLRGLKNHVQPGCEACTNLAFWLLKISPSWIICMDLYTWTFARLCELVLFWKICIHELYLIQCVPKKRHNRKHPIVVTGIPEHYAKPISVLGIYSNSNYHDHCV